MLGSGDPPLSIAGYPLNSLSGVLRESLEPLPGTFQRIGARGSTRPVHYRREGEGPIRVLLVYQFLSLYQGHDLPIPVLTEVIRGRHLPNTPNTCLLYTSPSPRD